MNKGTRKSWKGKGATVVRGEEMDEGNWVRMLERVVEGAEGNGNGKPLIGKESIQEISLGKGDDDEEILEKEN